MHLPQHLPLLASAVALLFIAAPSRAAMTGEEAPTPQVRAKIINEAQAILRGEIATGRPDLLFTVQANAATDFTDLVSRVVGDDTTYNGLTATLEEAITAATDDARRQYVIYNLARVHLLRSQLIRPGVDRRGPLNAAASAAEKFDRGLRDPAAWELKGDIEAERGRLDEALSAYRLMKESGAPAAQVQYKTGWAYERANRMALAETAYNAAALAQSTAGTGGPQLRHLIYQGLARTALSQGNDPAALAALARSAKAGQDESSPYRYRLDAAYRLLQRGYAREALAYANAALAASPDDPDALSLRDRARAQSARH